MTPKPKEYIGYDYNGLKIYPRLDLSLNYRTIGSSADPIMRNTDECIFCGSQLKANNKTQSHLIPELFGKNATLNDFECDDCNKMSGRWESSVGTFLTPIRIGSKIKNKKSKIPKFKSRLDDYDYPTEIFMDELGVLKVKLATAEDFKILDDEIAKLTFRLGGANPFHIYKVFLKIALSLMPDKKLKKEQWMKQLLFSDNVTKQIYPCMYQIYTDQMIFPEPYFELKQLAVQHKYHPQYLLIAYFGKTILEIVLPIKKPKNKIVVNMPPILEIQGVRKTYEVEKIDLSNNENKRWNMTFTLSLENSYIDNSY